MINAFLVMLVLLLRYSKVTEILFKVCAHKFDKQNSKFFPLLLFVLLIHYLRIIRLRHPGNLRIVHWLLRILKAGLHVALARIYSGYSVPSITWLHRVVMMMLWLLIG